MNPDIRFLTLNRSRYSAVLPAAEGTKVHPLSQRPAQRPEASQHFHQHRPTAAQDRRLWAGQDSRPSLFSQGKIQKREENKHTAYCNCSQTRSSGPLPCLFFNYHCPPQC